MRKTTRRMGWLEERIVALGQRSSTLCDRIARSEHYSGPCSRTQASRSATI